MGICAEYSGIILNQNARSESLTAGEGWHYQTFRFPENFARGVGEQIRYPSLSGFQILVESASIGAVLNYSLEQNNKGIWLSLAKGTVAGIQATDVETWMDVILDEEVPVTAAMASINTLFRIGFQAASGIAKFYLAVPNPLHNSAEAYESDGRTPLSPSASFAFRILALSADSGTDFIGDPYRSVVITAKADEANGENSSSGYWLSSPQPSQFAVTSHYTDLRPVPSVPIIESINYALNPNISYGVTPWTDTGPNLSGTATLTRITQIGSFQFGEDCLQVLTTGLINEGARLSLGVLRAGTYNASFFVSIAHPNEEFEVWAGIQTAPIKMFEGTITEGFEPRRSGTFVADGSTNCELFIRSKNASVTEMYISGVQITAGAALEPYFDGDSVSCQWSSQRGDSISVRYAEPSVENESVVIDSVLIDPMTPGVGFNIYYTNDLIGSEGEGEMTEEDWEQKLWVRVPQTYVTTVKTTYVLPEPVVAKFMKIEFTNLQARPYNPGDFQKPTKYKIFPEWVALPFLAELATPAFVAQRVGVAYDALELLYKPLITDLIQAPNSPLLPIPVVISPPNENQVDPDTLNLIDLTINKYLEPPAAKANKETLLGSRASATSITQTNYPVEVEPTKEKASLLLTSGPIRQSIVLDQSIPVFFFWVTCRHEYKEQFAELENNRAYFAGLKEIAFLRETYTTTSDKELYIEPGADDVNTERNEFFVSEGTWFAYAL